MSRTPRARQRGQAAVFVTVMLVVVLLALVFLYKAGRFTTEKMQLQNAADAAAYSTSLIEARDLNFAAYMNRAMVANEVAIGQLVGLASWADHWGSFYNYLNGYTRQFFEPIFPPVTTPIANGISGGARVMFQVPGEFLGGVFGDVLANTGTTVLHNVNKGYGYGQQVFHWASVVYALGTMNEVLQRNAPEAKLSDYGLLAMIAHTATYGSLPGTPGSFIKTYRSAGPSGAPSQPASGEPSPSENQAGMQRLAGVIHDSRDDFSRARGWQLPLEIPPLLPVDLHPRVNIGFDAGFASLTFRMDIDLTLDFSMDRFGGSELRYIGSNADGRRFGWEAADTTGASIDFYFRVDAEIEGCLLGVCASVGAGGTASLGNNRANLVLAARILGEEIRFTVIPNVPFPTTAPFSSGSAQAGSLASGNFAGRPDLSIIADPGRFRAEDYGGAQQNLSAWEIGAPFMPALTDPPAPCVTPGGPCQVPVVTTTMPHIRHKVNKAYKGLPSYLDTVDTTDPWAFQAPQLIVGVVKDFDRIRLGAAPRDDGALGLRDRPADGEIAVLAKSEVYFKRPDDLAFFRRLDGQEEFGSAFNPYWNARLVETTHADRMVALWVQQKENFFDTGWSPPPVDFPDWGGLDGWLP